MAIGGVSKNNPTGYTIGGRRLGVQIGNKGADDIFGTNGTNTILTANIQATSSITVDKNQMILKGLQDEIDRTMGFRTDLTVAEKQKLADLQGKITDLEKLAQERRLTSPEIKKRADLYIQSYKILGKDYVDVESDTFLKEKSAAIDELLAPELKGEPAKRLASLKKLKSRLEARVADRGESVPETLLNQIRSVNKQISNLTTPRKMSELSVTEQREYDSLVKEVNGHAGQELLLDSKKKLKIERLQRTIDAINAGGVNTLI